MLLLVQKLTVPIIGEYEITNKKLEKRSCETKKAYNCKLKIIAKRKYLRHSVVSV